MIRLSKRTPANLSAILLGTLIVAACSSGSKQIAPFNPPALIDLTPDADRHIVTVPGGSLGLRPLFQPAKGTALPPTADRRRLINGLQCITAATDSPAVLFTLKPSIGELKTAAPSPIDLENASPGYYKVRHLDGSFFTEATTTPHTGLATFRFPNGRVFVAVEPAGSDSRLRLANPFEIEGHTTVMTGGAPTRCFFVVRFQWSAMSGGVLKNGKELPTTVWDVSGENLSAYFSFRALDGTEILLKAAASTISADDARELLDQEQTGWSFAWIRQKARESWDKELGQIRVWGDAELKNQFYGALSRAVIDAAFCQTPVGDAPLPLFQRLENEYQHALDSGRGIPAVATSAEGLPIDMRQVREAINRDNGAISPAWRTFAMLGLFPQNDQYLLMPPFFERVEISAQTSAAQPLVIAVKKPLPQPQHVTSARLNGKKLSSMSISQSQVNDGGLLELKVR